MRKFISVGVTIALVALSLLLLPGAAVAQDEGEPDGSSPENPIVVESIDQVPSDVQGVHNEDDCTTSYEWSVTTPGVEEESHQEFRYKRDHDAIKGVKEQRYAKVVPQSHQEFKFKRTVIDYATEYRFAKFTRTKTKAPDTPGYWQEFSPTKPETFEGPPAHPSDERGKWSAHKFNGGPGKDRQGVFQNDGGNGSWFFRQQPITHDWTGFGEWTLWEPMSHESWESDDSPLGSPEFHGQGTYADGTKWYREWQARPTGQTREVEAGSHTERSGWVIERPSGDGWVQYGERTVNDAPLTVFYNGKPGGTTDESKAVWVPYVPSDGWEPFGTFRWKDGIEPVDAWTEFYNGKNPGGLTEDDAVWVTYVPSGGWVQFDERKVIDVEGAPEVVTFYRFVDEGTCEEEQPKPDEEEQPKPDEEEQPKPDEPTKAEKPVAAPAVAQAGPAPTTVNATVTPSSTKTLPNTGGPHALALLLAASLLGLGTVLVRRRA